MQKDFVMLVVWLGKCKTILLNSEFRGGNAKEFYYARGLVGEMQNDFVKLGFGGGNKKQFFYAVCILFP